jgi:hypothetical protein
MTFPVILNHKVLRSSLNLEGRSST